MSGLLRLRPLGTRVIVRPAQVFQTKTASNIETVKVDDEGHQTGIVIAVGPEVKRVEEGAVVLYGKFTGTEAKLTPTTTLLVLEEVDLHCVIVDEADRPPTLELPPLT